MGTVMFLTVVVGPQRGEGGYPQIDYQNAEKSVVPRLRPAVAGFRPFLAGTFLFLIVCDRLSIVPVL